eukprot:12180_1
MNPMLCLTNAASMVRDDEDSRIRPCTEESHEEKASHEIPISSNEFYHKRQNRYTLPITIIDKLNTKTQRNTSHPHRQEDIVYLLIISNQIRALCQNAKDTINSCEPLQQRMIELNQLCDKYSDELWKRSNDVDVHQCILNISESLLSAKSTLEDALKVRFRRNTLFNEDLNTIHSDIGNHIAAFEMTLCGDNIPNYSTMGKASLGELQCIAGHRFYFGHGTKQNYQKAMECYTNSAELHNSDGMNHLAMMYEKGIGCIKNIDKAIQYYKSSMDLENMEATFNLANLYYHHFIYNDVSTAIELYKTAAENGHRAAQTTLAGLYEDGVPEYLQQNVQLSIKWYHKAAAEGDLEAKNNLAVVLLNNADYGSKEYAQAVRMLSEAANDGYAASQNNLGHCFEFGKGVERDESKALDWYERSAAQGYGASFVNLGYLQIKRGHYEAAFKSFLKASKDDTNIESWYYLGLMHEKGYFVPRNTHLALEYFEKASKKGHQPSKLKIANCFFGGSGGSEHNYSKAFEIYRKLALNGNDVAANNLAIMYEEGFGVDVDQDAAQMWYKMGAEQGNVDAQRNVERLNQQLGKRTVTVE